MVPIAWFGLIWCGLIHFGPVENGRFGWICFGVVWFELICSGVVWFGSAWLGLVGWFGGVGWAGVRVPVSGLVPSGFDFRISVYGFRFGSVRFVLFRTG